MKDIEEKKDELDLDDENIEIIKINKITDQAFLHLTEKKLMHNSLLQRSAESIEHLIETLKDKEGYKEGGSSTDHLREANVTLMSDTDLSIEPSRTACIWIETKKSSDDFKKKIKFLKRILEVDNEGRMADMVSNISEQELKNMTAHKKLMLLKDYCRLDEQP
ncbi:9134_t:CDS:2 [Funneliformis caledonium]|uniref:9134_t:CDS:1 n=1 Tax=Funneliformis caledonium TaxID=1117310 RepID=A0A9N9CUR8_9GLOM|nr:9134_t:CDS:2 [Funneliformis caledonium]